jgi:hypothetical protein
MNLSTLTMLLGYRIKYLMIVLTKIFKEWKYFSLMVDICDSASYA